MSAVLWATHVGCAAHAKAGSLRPGFTRRGGCLMGVVAEFPLGGSRRAFAARGKTMENARRRWV